MKVSRGDHRVLHARNSCLLHKLKVVGKEVQSCCSKWFAQKGALAEREKYHIAAGKPKPQHLGTNSSTAHRPREIVEFSLALVNHRRTERAQKTLPLGKTELNFN